MILNIGMLSNNMDVVTSLELRFLIDRHLAARSAGHHDVAVVYAHAAEGLLRAMMPTHSRAIANVSSRKGDGRLIGSALARQLPAAPAAAVNVVWLLRGARRPAIEALSEAFRHNPIFDAAIRMLCSRTMPPLPTSNNVAVKTMPIETAAAYRR